MNVYYFELTALSHLLESFAHVGQKNAKSTTNECRPSQGMAFVSRTFCPAARKEGACDEMFEGKNLPNTRPDFQPAIQEQALPIDLPLGIQEAM